MNKNKEVIIDIENPKDNDLISRQAVLDLVADYDLSMGQVVKGIHALPSVKPQKKTGHWIKMPLIEAGQTYSHKCSLCGRKILVTDVGLLEFLYCHCGARMEVEQNG